MSSIEQDLLEKLSYKKLLWKQGVFTILDVPVVSYRDNKGDLQRDDITDIDVLGYQYDDTLSRNIFIGDCKSGKQSINRLLWLKGLQTLLEAQSSAYISREINSKYAEIAKRLGILILKPSEINQTLIDHKFTEDLPIFQKNLFEKEKDFWESKKPSLKIRKFLLFLRYTYWALPPSRRTQSILHNFSFIVDELKDKNTFSSFVVYQTLLRLSLSVLDMAGYICRNGRDNLHLNIETYIFGPPEIVSEKKKAFENLKKGKKSKAVPNFYPEYYPSLIDLLSYIVRRSDSSKYIPNIIEMALYQNVLNNSPLNIDWLGFLDEERKLVSLKLTKDICDFLCSVCDISPEYFKELLNV